MTSIGVTNITVRLFPSLPKSPFTWCDEQNWILILKRGHKLGTRPLNSQPQDCELMPYRTERRDRPYRCGGFTIERVTPGIASRISISKL